MALFRAFKREADACSFYIIIWIIYLLQGVCYESGGSFSQMIFLIIMLLSFYYTYKCIPFLKKSGYLKALFYLVVLFSLYGIPYLISGEKLIGYGNVVSNKSYLKTIYQSLVPVYPFFYFTIKGLLSKQKLRFFAFIFVILATLRFFYNYNTLLENAAEFYGREEFTNNESYCLAALLPFAVLFRKQPLMKFGMLIYLVIMIIAGMKRGAILVSLIGLFWILKFDWKSTTKKQKIVLMFFGLVFIGSIGYYCLDLYNSSDYFRYRIERTSEGSSSSRDTIYQDLWNTLVNDTSIFYLIFGRGAYGSFRVGDVAAHNDWLEIAVSQGLIGVVLFAMYYIGFWKQLKLSKRNSEVYMIIGALFFYSFLRTFFSMSYSDTPIYWCVLMGWCTGTIFREQQHVINSSGSILQTNKVFV